MYLGTSHTSKPHDSLLSAANLRIETGQSSFAVLVELAGLVGLAEPVEGWLCRRLAQALRQWLHWL